MFHNPVVRTAAPIRYRHVPDEWPIRDYQTVFAREPGSAEMPSASRPFTTDVVTDLVARGVLITPLVLHTGVSSLEGGERPVPGAIPRADDDRRGHQRHPGARGARHRRRDHGGARRWPRSPTTEASRIRAKAGPTSSSARTGR